MTWVGAPCPTRMRMQASSLGKEHGCSGRQRFRRWRRRQTFVNGRSAPSAHLFSPLQHAAAVAQKVLDGGKAALAIALRQPLFLCRHAAGRIYTPAG